MLPVLCYLSNQTGQTGSKPVNGTGTVMAETTCLLPCVCVIDTQQALIATFVA